MVRKVLNVCVTFFITSMCFGCGHINKGNIGLISFGNLEGKSIPNNTNGPTLQGSASGHIYYLSDAARDALKGSEYDTLVDVEVITETGLLVWSNKVTVKGKAMNSNSFEQLGGKK